MNTRQDCTVELTPVSGTGDHRACFSQNLLQNLAPSVQYFFAFASVHFLQPSSEFFSALDVLERMGEKEFAASDTWVMHFQTQTSPSAALCQGIGMGETNERWVRLPGGVHRHGFSGQLLREMVFCLLMKM